MKSRIIAAQMFLAAVFPCFLLATPQVGYGQSTPPVGSQEQGLQSGQQPAKNSPTSELPRNQRDTYELFVMGIANEELNAERDERLGIDASHDRLNYVKILNIREDEERAMRILLLDTYYRVKELDKQVMADDIELNRHFTAELASKRTALAQQRPKVYEAVIEKLRQEFGEEDFKKLDAYVYRQGGGGTIATKTLPRAVSDRPQAGGNTAPATPTAVQP